jgi:hypothetical protein
VSAGNWLEFANAFELALERAVVTKSFPVNHLGCAKAANHIFSQPYLAVAAFPDAAKKDVIGDLW